MSVKVSAPCQSVIEAIATDPWTSTASCPRCRRAAGRARPRQPTWWFDFTCTIDNDIAVISSTVPDPAGFAIRGATITFRGEFRAGAPFGRADPKFY